jgi:magnesium chelatase subunit I
LHFFVINELPDLQARIQVALFNILQEGDIQIRGFKLRMPLDLQFIHRKPGIIPIAETCDY